MGKLKSQVGLLPKLIFALMMVLLFLQTKCYLEFTLHRHETPSADKQLILADDVCLDEKGRVRQEGEEEFFHEICYYKDLAYAIELFYQDKLYEISVDLTSPYSWLKGSSCQILDKSNSGEQQLHQKCQLLNQRNGFSSRLGKQRPSSAKGGAEPKHLAEESSESHSATEQNGNQKRLLKKQSKASRHYTSAEISGSNQIIEGKLESHKEMEFWTKDSSHLSRLGDILLLGLYILEEKEKVTLEDTNFINVTKLSENIDTLCDGALSLRFDRGSENSFLEEIFAYVGSGQQIVTIYLDDQGQGILTLGQLSIKNSEDGYSSIVWVDVGDLQEEEADEEEEHDEEQNEDQENLETQSSGRTQEYFYGNLPKVHQIALESVARDKEYVVSTFQDESAEDGDDLEDDAKGQSQKGLKIDGHGISSLKKVELIFSLSASYIGLPEKVLRIIINQFLANYDLVCSISPHTYLECEHQNHKQAVNTVKDLEESLLILIENGGTISIPLQDLILEDGSQGSKAGKSGEGIFSKRKSKKKVLLNMRMISKDAADVEKQARSQKSSKSSSTEQKSYIILGEPYFNKYYTVFDYKKNRIGFAPKRVSPHNTFVNVVFLIRFVTTVFVFGCSFILCFKPIQAMFMAFKKGTDEFGTRFFKNRGDRPFAEGRKLIRYEPIEENSYDEVTNEVRRVISQEQ